LVHDVDCVLEGVYNLVHNIYSLFWRMCTIWYTLYRVFSGGCVNLVHNVHSVYRGGRK